MSSAALLRLMKAMGEKLPTTVSKAKPIVTKTKKVVDKPIVTKTKKVVDKPIATKTIDTPIVTKTKDTPIVSKTKTSKFGSLAEAKIAAQERGAKTFRYEGKVYKTPVKDSKRVRQNLSDDSKSPKERQKEKKYLIDKTLNSLPGGTKRFKVDPKNKNRLIDKKTGKPIGIAQMNVMVKEGKGPPQGMRRQTLTPKGQELFDDRNYEKILQNPKRYMYEGVDSPLTPKQQPPKTKVDREVAKEKFDELSKKDKVEFLRNVIDPELTSSQISDVLGITSRSQAVKLPKATIRKIDASKPLPKGEVIKRLIDVFNRQIKNKALTESQKNKIKDQLKKLAKKYNKGTSIIGDISSKASSEATEKEIKNLGGFSIKTSGFKKGGKVTSKKKKIIKPKTIKTAKKKSALRGIGSAKRGYGKAMGRA